MPNNKSLVPKGSNPQDPSVLKGSGARIILGRTDSRAEREGFRKANKVKRCAVCGRVKNEYNHVLLLEVDHKVPHSLNYDAPPDELVARINEGGVIKSMVTYVDKAREWIRDVGNKRYLCVECHDRRHLEQGFNRSAKFGHRPKSEEEILCLMYLLTTTNYGEYDIDVTVGRGRLLRLYFRISELITPNNIKRVPQYANFKKHASEALHHLRRRGVDKYTQFIIANLGESFLV